MTSLAWGEHPIDTNQPAAYDELHRQERPCWIRMSLRICKFCGEPIAPHGNALSRNPNLCASCSSLADGMDDSADPNSVARSVPVPQPSPAAAQSDPVQTAPPAVSAAVGHRH